MAHGEEKSDKSKRTTDVQVQEPHRVLRVHDDHSSRFRLRGTRGGPSKCSTGEGRSGAYGEGMTKAKKPGDATTPRGSPGGPPGKKQRAKARKNGKRRG